MAVSIGNIWDSTSDVLAGRAGLLAPVAALAFFLPAVVQAAVDSYGGQSTGAAALSAAVALVGVIAAVWGSLTVIGIATDPAVTRQDAGAAAMRRIGAALLVSLVLGVVAVLVVLPVIIVLAASGFDFQAATHQAGSSRAAPMAPGAALFVFLYSLALLVALLWAAARLAVLSPVILHERRGIGAIGRSIALTRGLSLKLVGAVLLLFVVWGVATLAARYIVFLPLRLMLGSDNLATAAWLGAIASAAVAAVFSTLVAVFTARLYVALTPITDHFDPRA